VAIESVAVTEGSGKNIAVDTVAGKELQVVKLGLGAEDALDNVVDAGQQTMAASVPVAIASNQSAVPVTAGAGSVVEATTPLDPHNLVPNSTEADQALTVDATAGGVQFAAFHADTTHVEWDCQTAQIRVTFDNSAPTATNGHLIEIGATGIWPKAKASAAKFIRTGGVSGVLHASQLKGA
jgi:hypothetical protein